MTEKANISSFCGRISSLGFTENRRYFGRRIG